jgi:threonyl-tRNA synthetase
MSTLDEKRHSLAHLLAAAVLDLYPDTKPTIGPAVDNGFYYDFEFSSPLKDEALKDIEKRMKKISNSWTSFEKKKVSADEAREIFKNNPYKLELIEEIVSKGEPITLYTSGSFTDLCRGGHAEDFKEVSMDAFKLSRIAGAYWRGDEKNIMLTRIYGLAFDTSEDLKAYETLQEEAKKRDHRKIAKEQGLLVFSDMVGSGMPMYTPKGNSIRNAIIGYSRELNDRLGFGEVHTPNINKAELFKTSGHYDQYKEDMLSVRSQYVSDEMFLKPMNCPQHTQIYASAQRSYRDLPIRYADFANLYRDERPGELSGLTRLRSFAQDDGHIFCREDQIETEVSNVLSAIQDALKTYKIDFWMRFSLRDPKNKEKYLGPDEVWEKSQAIMRKLLIEKNIEYKEVEGEAAFYGPKIDIMAVDAIGREWQISTVQLDFVQPTRFGLEYIAEDGSRQTPVMIHRALIGSPDRFLGLLIEHYAGAFPLWLSPVHVKILPIGEGHFAYAEEIKTRLKTEHIRVELDDASESLGKKIRNAKMEKVPYLLVLGDKEVADKTITLESRDGSEPVQLSIDELVSKLKEEIKEKK